MSIRQYLEALPLNDLVHLKDADFYRNSSRAFTGSPRRHPYDKEKLLLIHEPDEDKQIIYEFLIRDITHVEAESTLADDQGKNLSQVKLWVQKGCWGMKSSPFEII